MRFDETPSNVTKIIDEKRFFDKSGQERGNGIGVDSFFPLLSSIFAAQIRILCAPVVRVLPALDDDGGVSSGYCPVSI